jgi:hypothetical protein
VSAPLTPCAHTRTITKEADETFEARTGCLDCGEWLQPVRLKVKAPLTHATVMGLAHIRGDSGWFRAPLFRRACDGEPDKVESFAPSGATNTVNIPTCPKCAVLRDAALEGREVTPC